MTLWGGYCYFIGEDLPEVTHLMSEGWDLSPGRLPGALPFPPSPPASRPESGKGERHPLCLSTCGFLDPAYPLNEKTNNSHHPTRAMLQTPSLLLTTALLGRCFSVSHMKKQTQEREENSSEVPQLRSGRKVLRRIVLVPLSF